MAFLDFAINGSFVAQILNGSAYPSVANPTVSIAILV